MKEQLHRKLIEEFNLRGTPLDTRKTYTYCIGRFERHCGWGAARLGRERVRRYLLHLVEHEHLSAQTHNVHAAALWFLYTKVLERPKVRCEPAASQADAHVAKGADARRGRAAVYVHVSTARLQSVKSPLERLRVPAPPASSPRPNT